MEQKGKSPPMGLPAMTGTEPNSGEQTLPQEGQVLTPDQVWEMVAPFVGGIEESDRKDESKEAGS